MSKTPMFLLVRGEGSLFGYAYVYERTSTCDILVWSGLIKDLNEDEFPIFAEIFEEDLI